MLKSVLAILATLALLVNSYAGFVAPLMGEGFDVLGGDGDAGGGGDAGGVIIPADFTVSLPEKKLRESIFYYYDIYAEMYWENTTSGNWSRRTLFAEGTLSERNSDLRDAEDGFGQTHTAVPHRVDTAAAFEVIIEDHDSEPLIVHGNMVAKRTDYNELETGVAIKAETEGDVELDQLPGGVNVPGGLSYEGYLLSYMDPYAPEEETLEEQIFNSRPAIAMGDNGTVADPGEFDWNNFLYKWEVEGAERVAGYDCLVVNVSSRFFDWIDFYRLTWYSSQVPYPVKSYIHSNSTWEDEDEYGYMLLDQNRTLKKGGFSRGDRDIDWGDEDPEAVFEERHPRGEFKTWDMWPADGQGVDETSFHFTMEEAAEYAMGHSPGVGQFLDEHPDAFLDYNFMNATKEVTDVTGNKAGNYIWNITFGAPRPRDEEEWWELEYEYCIAIQKNITRTLLGYEEEFSIYDEWGQIPYGSRYHKSEFEDEILTLASSEAIIKTNPRAAENMYDPRTGELVWAEGGSVFALEVSAAESENSPGAKIAELLTGISLPTTRFTYGAQVGSVWEEGDTTSAGVDAETGRYVYYMEAQGTALASFFD